MFAVLQLDCSKPELLWPKIGKMHTQEPGSWDPRTSPRRISETPQPQLDPVLRSGNRQGAAGLPCRAGFLQTPRESQAQLSGLQAWAFKSNQEWLWRLRCSVNAARIADGRRDSNKRTPCSCGRASRTRVSAPHH